MRKKLAVLVKNSRLRKGGQDEEGHVRCGTSAA